MVLIRAMVQESAFGERKINKYIQLGFASLNRTSIFYLMQNLIPSHELPFAICIAIIKR